MAANGQTSWQMKGEEVGNCNCIWACPCQFNELPTHGDCEAFLGYEVHEGSFGDVDLAGVRWALVVAWPGPIHEGNGTRQLVIDESASPEQRDAVQQLVDGEHGGPYFEIFASVLPNRRDTMFEPIEIETDRERRVASIRVGSFGESRIEPIKNPVSGEEHRVRIDLPDGFEYKQAEIANTVTAKVSAEAPLDLDLDGTYGQLNPFDWSNA
jgi:hypothetical protein